MMARNKVCEWQSALDDLLDSQPDSNYPYRHRDRETANHRLTGAGNGGIMIISTGGRLADGTPTKPNSGWQAAHAERYYAEIASHAPYSDARRIAAHTSFTEKQVEDIRQHVFVEKHDFGDGEYHRFYPSYQQALTWQRLKEGNGSEEDELWLKHELEELTLIRDFGYNVTDAHELAEQRYPWWETVREKVGEDYVGEIQDD